MRPTPFRPADTVAEAEDRQRRWRNGEYDAIASLQEVLGFTDAEMQARTSAAVVPTHKPGALRGAVSSTGRRRSHPES